VRIREKVAHGDGGILALKKAIRAHGNGVEHLVVVGLQVFALELMKPSPTVVAALVIVFTTSRILRSGRACWAPCRACAGSGAVGTYASELGGAAAVLVALLARA
jgi:uncharacterized membrane protein YecN with MAPEG domain